MAERRLTMITLWGSDLSMKKTRVLKFESRWSRFIGLRKFKKEHPNVRVIKKYFVPDYSLTQGGLFDATVFYYYAVVEY